MGSRKKNGYVLVPNVDPDDRQSLQKPKNRPPDLKPGLFVHFGKDRRMDRHGHPAASESEDIELKDLKPRKKPKKLKSPKSPSSKRSRQEFIEEPVLEGDTIQRISLRYSCPVAELRRLNKLYSDLDLHALKTIKIPVKEHSLLLEASEREKRRNLVVENGIGTSTHSSGGNSTDEVHFGGSDMYYNSDDTLSQDADDERADDSDTPEYRDISIQSALKWKHSRQTLFNKLDEDLEKAKTTVENQKSNLKEVQIVFDTPSVHPVVQEYTKQMFELPDWRILAAASIFVFLMIVIGIFVYRSYK